MGAYRHDVRPRMHSTELGKWVLPVSQSHASAMFNSLNRRKLLRIEVLRNIKSFLASPKQEWILAFRLDPETGQVIDVMVVMEQSWVNL